MTTTQTKVESQIMESSAKALGTFCSDISQMFSVDMSCNQLEPATETVRDLKRRFEKLVAVISVKSEGLLKGTFHFIFDTKGLFTLPGVIIMLPEKRILDNVKYGSDEDAENMSDTMGEAGNLMAGSWDRVFREEFEGHGHFAQFDTFVGSPRNIPIDKMGLANDEEVLFVLHEMTIGSYPPFNCGVIFPKSIFDNIPELDTEITDDTEKEDEDKTEEKTQEQQAPTQQPEIEKSTDDEQARTEEQPEIGKSADDEQAHTEEQPEPTDRTGGDISQTDADSDNVKQEVISVANELCEEHEISISESIKRMTELSADFAGKLASVTSTICAKDIMQNEVIWASGDDSVQQALEKMDAADTGCLIVGTAGVLEGIISRSDLTGAMSPYLRPIFAKWHRPTDDATLQIKIKWIMSKPVHTVNPEIPLSVIMENMCRRNGHYLPVVDSKGKVQGVITMYDVLSVLLKAVFD